MNLGKIIEVIGAVVDIEFPLENIPKINEALKVTETNTILEVQQQLGGGIVRTIAMGTTDGFRRGDGGLPGGAGLGAARALPGRRRRAVVGGGPRGCAGRCGGAAAAPGDAGRVPGVDVRGPPDRLDDFTSGAGCGLLSGDHADRIAVATVRPGLDAAEVRPVGDDVLAAA